MMNALLAQEASLALGPSTALVLGALVIFLGLFFWAWSGIERGFRPSLRSLQPINRLRRIIGQSAETGQSVHYSPGTGGLNGQIGTAETLNGLTSLASVARVAARTKADLIVTADDTLAYMAADDVVKAQYAQAGRTEDYDPAQVRFVTQQDRLAYMAGITGLLSEEKLAGNLMLGRLESEYLLAGDRANRRDLPQVVGSSRVEAMPLMLASAGPENALLGEELFAAPAYLDREPAHLAGVVAQDRIRLVIIALIIAGVIAATVIPGFSVGNILLR